MAHTVDVSMQAFNLSKAGTAITLEIYDNDQKLGEIEIGKGSFGWKSANQQDFIRKNWTSFCQLLDRHM